MSVVRVTVLFAVCLLGCALVVAAVRVDRGWYEVHLLVNRCALDRSAAAGAIALRLSLSLLGVLALASLRRVDRLLRDIARPGGSSRGAVLRGSLAVVLAILAAEAVLRWRLPPAGPRPVSFPLPPPRKDARLSWALDGPRTTAVETDGRSIAYAVDAMGDRARTETDTPDPARPTILFAGESVMLGLGVEWDETFPALVGKRLGVQIVNASVYGYGDDQVYRSMVDHLARLERPVAVVTIALAEMLERDMSSWRDRLVVADDGSLVVAREQPKFWRDSPLLALVERVAPWEDDASLRVARSIFQAADRAAKARGAHALFLLTNFQRPCLPDASGRPSIEARLFDGLAVDHIRVDLDPSWIVRSNSHPDARAHARIADALADALGSRLQ